MSHSKQKSKKNSEEVLRDQIHSLGGTEEDLELVRQVEKGHSGKSSTVAAADDVALTKDVSAFLKNLNINSGVSDAAEEPSPDPKPSAAKSKSKDNKKNQGDRNSKNASKLLKEKKEKTSAAAPPALSLSAKTTSESKLKHRHAKFIVDPISLWYTALPPLPPAAKPLDPITHASLSSLSSKAQELHASDSELYQSTSAALPSSSDVKFLSQILSSGTLSDRLSALTLLVQGSPVHNTKALDTLRSMAERGKGSGGRGESLKALRCIVDWWIGGGAPERKLKYFRDQPLTHSKVTDAHLVLWHFEDWLKKFFFSVLQILETLTLDPLPYVRTQSLSLVTTLLRDRPEQEQNLLRLLVNKLGDNEKPICARTSYHLLQVLQTHPSMKAVIINEVVNLVLRPPTATASSSSMTASAAPTNKHIRFDDAGEVAKLTKEKQQQKNVKREGNPHARYYAAITFNQIVLTSQDRDVARKLLDVYFEMFKEILGEPESEEPADGDEAEETEDNKDKDGRGRVKVKGKGKSKGKMKAKEVKGDAGFAEVENTQSRLVSALLTGVNRALPFAKMDATDARLNKHLDTLFLITHTSTFNISLQALVLIQHICVSISKANTTSSSSSSSAVTNSLAKTLTDRYYRALYASLHDSRLAQSSKQAMYLNLFFRSIKSDVDTERVRALVRRFVQVLATGGSGATEFVAGGLFLLGELFSSVPGLREMLSSSNDSSSSADDNSESTETYDPRKRDPQYAHASSSPLWELVPLLTHYHPTVSLHAHQLLSGQPLTASADLSLNTLTHFLDRFVFKNPKKPKPRGASAMQPAAAAGGASEGVKLLRGEVADVEGTMNDEKRWLKMKEGDVPVDQIFFHRYFTKRSDREKARAKKAENRKGDVSDSDAEMGEEDEEDNDEDEDDEGDDDVKGKKSEKAGAQGNRLDDEDSGFESQPGLPDDFDDQDENSDAEEAEIWKAMKASMPAAEGDDSLMEDSDEVPSDLDGSNDEDTEEDEENDGSSQSEKDDDDNEGSDHFSLAEGSDDDDLIDLDADAPTGLIEYDGPDADGADEEEEWGGVAGSSQGNNKRKREKESRKEARKKLRSLPTFASYEDYAKMIEDGPEDDI